VIIRRTIGFSVNDWVASYGNSVYRELIG